MFFPCNALLCDICWKGVVQRWPDIHFQNKDTECFLGYFYHIVTLKNVTKNFNFISLTAYLIYPYFTIFLTRQLHDYWSLTLKVISRLSPDIYGNYSQHFLLFEWMLYAFAVVWRLCLTGKAHPELETVRAGLLERSTLGIEI